MIFTLLYPSFDHILRKITMPLGENQSQFYVESRIFFFLFITFIYLTTVPDALSDRKRFARVQGHRPVDRIRGPKYMSFDFINKVL